MGKLKSQGYVSHVLTTHVEYQIIAVCDWYMKREGKYFGNDYNEIVLFLTVFIPMQTMMTMTMSWHNLGLVACPSSELV